MAKRNRHRFYITLTATGRGTIDLAMALPTVADLLEVTYDLDSGLASGEDINAGLSLLDPEDRPVPTVAADLRRPDVFGRYHTGVGGGGGGSLIEYRRPHVIDLQRDELTLVGRGTALLVSSGGRDMHFSILYQRRKATQAEINWLLAQKAQGYR